MVAHVIIRRLATAVRSEPVVNLSRHELHYGQQTIGPKIEQIRVFRRKARIRRWCLPAHRFDVCGSSNSCVELFRVEESTLEPVYSPLPCTPISLHDAQIALTPPCAPAAGSLVRDDHADQTA